MLIYRKEIDGLRALALLPVIFYHAGFLRLFPGGYVGVDVFFVISGYLITSLIDMELRDGTFSLLHFYERRCRRILPALYLILLTTCYFVAAEMSPSRLREFGYSLISIVTFSSNIFFWWKDDNYFSRLTEWNPVVHTWSLAVEEQFYLFFPLLCYFLGNRRHYLLMVLGCMALFSFSLAQWGGNMQRKSGAKFYMFLQHPWASFYMPLGRVWELLLGSFAAFYMKSDRSLTYVSF
jgi:peptidoglycan/LPS O-acetylase OafA/YrhL